jgi:ferredoxin
VRSGGKITPKGAIMKVRIDPDLCTACGLCTDGVPQVFKMGKDTAEVINPAVPPTLEKAVKDAATDCPAEAIILE